MWPTQNKTSTHPPVFPSANVPSPIPTVSTSDDSSDSSSNGRVTPTEQSSHHYIQNNNLSNADCQNFSAYSAHTTSQNRSLHESQQGNRAAPNNWCTVNYYELSTKVGETFHGSEKVITIDGFTDPSVSSNRFSLGLLTNINRTDQTKYVRKVIGRGIEILWENNLVILHCKSNHQVFVQSPNFNERVGWDVSTVVKVSPNSKMTIFDMKAFSKLLATSIPQGFEEVYGLSRMCTIRISFIKGWGVDYRRQSVINTPCWLELRLNGPLKWVDVILNELKPDVANISSVS